MAVPQAIRAEYARWRSSILQVSKRVDRFLAPYCKREHFVVFSRIKDLESLSEKLESGKFRNWSEIHDLLACTIVVNSSADIDKVQANLTRFFRPVLTKDHSNTPKAPDVFRYDGLRWYGQLRPDDVKEMSPEAAALVFEIQVLTPFEYAWTKTTHSLVYKGDAVGWRELRLAAQLKAAVEQIETIIAAFGHAAEGVPPSPWEEGRIKERIVTTFRSWVASDRIPEEVQPKSWRRFGDNVYSFCKSINEADPEAAFDSLARQIELDFLQRGNRMQITSGSLFQFVVAAAWRDRSLPMATDFAIVESPEYQLHDTGAPPLKFQMSEFGKPQDLDEAEEPADS